MQSRGRARALGAEFVVLIQDGTLDERLHEKVGMLQKQGSGRRASDGGVPALSACWVEGGRGGHERVVSVLQKDTLDQ